MPSKALVWFKRDLRLHDHAPLCEATVCDEAMAMYIIEPEWLTSSEFDAQHIDFVLQSLAPLQTALAARGLALQVRVGNATTVLQDIAATYAFTHLFSHEETGSGWTYARDIDVSRWCKTQGVAWHEWPQSGVVRPLQSRFGWAKRWAQRMNEPQLAAPASFCAASARHTTHLRLAPTLADLGLPAHQRPLPAAGEEAAWHTMRQFTEGGGARGYRRALSSPLTAEHGCSRLSAHLAYGTISMRSVHQATEAVIAQTADRSLAGGLRGFAGRLRWHCHFMQKLEDEPNIEFSNFSRAYDGLREAHFNRGYFDAWCAGMTGFPMVDACMRSLKATGWLNFRMRAMLVSFASNHLWLHWRETGQFLAQQFLDFEPGIHWSQMQMQSGTTGINTFRIYSPSKQAADHDPEGIFANRWIPELGTAAYPAPIVDERMALKYAKDTLYGLRATPQARTDADAVQKRHGSRKSGMPRSTSGQSAPQKIRQASNVTTAPKRPRQTESSAQQELF